MVYPDGYNCRMITKFDKKTSISGIIGNRNPFSQNVRNDSMVDVLYISSFSGTRFIPTNVCKYFDNLKKFDICGEMIEEIQSDIFDGCKNITEVLIKSSRIKSIDSNFVSSLTSLQVFTMENTKVEFIHQDFFKNNLNLKKLNLDRNQLKVIDVDFDLLPALEALSVLANPCISSAYSKNDPRSPTLIGVIIEIGNKCNNNTNPNVLSTTPPPVESSVEQRIINLEIKLDKTEEAEKNTSATIQESTKKMQEKIEKIKKDHEEFKINFNKFEPTVNNIKAEYGKINEIGDTFRKNSQKISINYQNLETSLDSIKELKKQNQSFKKDIEHTEKLMWGIFAVQIVTIAFAVYFTVYVKFV
jgi:hypothetical protein